MQYLLLLFLADPGLLGRVDQFLKETSQLTGFPIKRKVPAAMMSRVELEQYLKSKMDKEVDPRKVQTEELVLKLFGFAPQDFQLKQTTLDLLGEQAAAFYDFKDRKLYILDHVQESLGPELLIHELSHALADQRYGLRRFLGKAKDDDAALARMAVMEGQAMWLMAEHAAREAGTSLRESPDLVSRFSDATEGDGGSPVMNTVPLYLKESLLFPYSWGFRFQAAVCEKVANCLSHVFENPPQSSSQVMHPHLYFSGVLPEKIVAPPAPRGWRTRADGTLGEIDLSILLRTYQQEPKGVVESLRGASYKLYENRRTRNHLLSHASTWKDDEAAIRWMNAYVAVLGERWKKMEIVKRDLQTVSGKGDRGPFLVRRAGRQVFIEEGLPIN